jgi:energy-coupling factor transporter ATP-binding protein EcfA2
MEKLDVILLIGRPAAGKSEAIDFLKQLPEEKRLQEYHIARFEELDDFLYVWQTFENDKIREHMGLPRRDTDASLHFLDDRIWDFFIERIDLDFRKKLARDPLLLEHHTVIMEFARGGENGFANAFQHLSDDVLSRASILYVDVSFEESLRKNRRRYRPEQADSILYHSLEDPKMERYYRDNDWARLSGGHDEGFITVKGHEVPFAVFHNEPEKTLDLDLLGAALRDATGRLVKLFTHKG